MIRFKTTQEKSTTNDIPGITTHKFLTCILATTMIVFTTGCGSAAQLAIEAVSDDYKEIVDAHLEIILDYDSYGEQFDLALEAVESYLNGELSCADTQDEIASIQSALTDCYNSLEDYSISEELSDIMLKYDVLPEEFEYFANLRASQAAEYVNSLQTVSYYLQYADEYELEHEEVEFWYLLESTLQDAYRGYYFYGSVNYWFAEWDEESTEYVQEEVIPQLKCYIPETWYWETSQTAAENKAMSYLDLVEECVTMAAEHLGNTNESLNELKAAMAELEEIAEGAE